SQGVSRNRRALRRRSLRLLLRRSQGPHLLLGQALARAAGGADGPAPDRPRSLLPARARALVHGGGSLAVRPPAWGGQRLPRRLSRAGTRTRLRLPRRRVPAAPVAPGSGEPRLGAEARQQGDWQGDRGGRDTDRSFRDGKGGRRALREAAGRSLPRRVRYPATGGGGRGGGAQESAPAV